MEAYYSLILMSSLNSHISPLELCTSNSIRSFGFSLVSTLIAIPRYLTITVLFVLMIHLLLPSIGACSKGPLQLTRNDDADARVLCICEVVKEMRPYAI